mmetsp:Transcript_23625/g.33152  ORF Transcript_23625/g.33152 Transcript_23625/m.33152 type:complete len:206 (-) Transcript_23625:680-1297(-)
MSKMTPSTPFSVKPAMDVMFLVPSTLILSPLCAMKSALVPTVHFTTPNKSSMERKMLPITTPVVTTPLERKLSTVFLIASVSLLITVPDSKVSLSSMPLVEVPGLVLDLCSSKGYRLTMDASPNFPLPFLLLLRFLLPLWNPTTLSSPPTPFWSTPTVLSALTMKLFTMSAVATLVLNVLPTPTLTGSLLKSSVLSRLLFVSMEP